jgi:dTDP-4-dehydrorhamnose reductase
MKKNTLVIGASGLLGNSFLKFSSDVNIFANVFRHQPLFPSTTIKLDLFNVKSLKTFINECNIKTILNFAALADVERCSLDPDLAYSLNSIIPKNLALAASDTDSSLVHISTDHLFGNKDVFHDESDEVCLLNKYAETKYKGEKLVESNCKKAIILRTNFFCLGYNKISFADWIINSIKAKSEIELFSDVYFNPVHSFKIFHVIDLLLKEGIAGLFNVSSNERISKLDFGLSLADRLNLDTKYISNGSLSEFNKLKTKRPKNMLLSNKKLISNIEIDLCIQSSIDTYVNEISEGM